MTQRAHGVEECGWYGMVWKCGVCEGVRRGLPGVGGLDAAMGGMVNDVGSQDGAAGTRAVEEFGWHDVGTRRVRRGARRGLSGAGSLGARWVGWSMMCDRGMTRRVRGVEEF